MANVCEYKITVKGKKNACYAFFGSMSVLDCKLIEAKSGTDDDYSMTIHGDCQWAVDWQCTPWSGAYPVSLPEDANAAMNLAEEQYWYKTVRDRSKMFGVEVLCNSADKDDGGVEIFQHYRCGEDIGGECPDELRILDLLPDGYCKCVSCGQEFPKDDCNEYGEGTYFCHACFAYTFGM